MQRIVGETECKSKFDFKIHTHPGRDHIAKCMKRRDSQTLGTRKKNILVLPLLTPQHRKGLLFGQSFCIVAGVTCQGNKAKW